MNVSFHLFSIPFSKLYVIGPPLKSLKLTSLDFFFFTIVSTLLDEVKPKISMKVFFLQTLACSPDSFGTKKLTLHCSFITCTSGYVQNCNVGHQIVSLSIVIECVKFSEQFDLLIGFYFLAVVPTFADSLRNKEITIIILALFILPN